MRLPNLPTATVMPPTVLNTNSETPMCLKSAPSMAAATLPAAPLNTSARTPAVREPAPAPAPTPVGTTPSGAPLPMRETAPLALHAPAATAPTAKASVPTGLINPAVIEILNTAAAHGWDTINGVRSVELQLLWVKLGLETAETPAYQHPALRSFTPMEGNILIAKAYLEGGGKELQHMLQGDAAARTAAVDHTLSYQITQLHGQLISVDAVLNLMVSPGQDGSIGMVANSAAYEKSLMLRERIQRQLHAAITMLRAVQQPGGLRLNFAQQINVAPPAANGSSPPALNHAPTLPTPCGPSPSPTPAAHECDEGTLFSAPQLPTPLTGDRGAGA